MNSKNFRFGTVVSTLLVPLLLAACGDNNSEAMMNSAKSYLANNDSKGAVIQIKNALQGNPNLPEARFLLGSTLLDSGDAVGAETELRKALALKHSPDLVIPELAKAVLVQGQAKKLTDEFDRIELSQASARASLQMSLTLAYAMQGKSELSQAALKAALLADPGYAPALIVQARQKAGQRDFEGALAMVDDVIVKTPASFEAWKLKGDILLYAKSEFAGALVAYRKAVEIKPDFLEAHVAATTMLLREGNLSEAERQIAQIREFAPQHPQTMFLEALLAFRKKDIVVARNQIQGVLKFAPQNAQGLQLAGAVELELNALPAALDYLRRAVQARPDLSVARRLLAVTHLRLRQPDQALAALLPGLNRAKVDPSLFAVAGEVYLQNGDVEQAQVYFTKATAQNPKDGRSRTSLALLHLLDGKVESAFDELQDIAVSDTGTTADLSLIGMHLRRQEFDQALKAIERLEKKQADNPLPSHLKANVLLARHDMAGARKNLELALQIDPSYFPAMVSLARIDVAEKRPEDARKRFESAVAKNPKNGRAWLALAELAARSDDDNGEVIRLVGNAVAATPTDVAPRLFLIDFNLRHKDAKAALSAAQNAVAALSDSPEMLDALGRTQQAAGDLNQAMASYRKLAAMQPQSPQTHMRLAGLHMAEKNRGAALQSLRQALEVKPDLLDAQRAMIVLDLDDKKFKEALATARAVQKQRPKEPAGHMLEGDINAAQKNWDGAATAYRAGLKQENSTALAIKLHSVLLAGARGAEADRFSAAWQKENPEDAGYLIYLGERAISRQDYGSAETNLAAAIKQQPGNALAFNNLAWVSARLGRNTAVAYAEKANALAPNQPAIMDTLAMVRSQAGGYAKALEIQNKVLALQPENAIYKLNLAKIHLQGGKKELARKELDELGKLGSKFAAQAEVASLLRSLSSASGS